MAIFEKFNFKTLDDLKAKVQELKVDIKFTEDLSILTKPVKIGNFQLNNPLMVHPMEGCDGTEDGRPSELTLRRYQAFARGGAGFLWFEATAVVPSGRANPRQLFINKDTVDSFKEMIDLTNQAAKESMGDGHRPLNVLQLTHSGRYGKPHGKPEPVLTFHDPALDERQGISADYPVISDEELDQLQEKYIEASLLAKEAGFDGVDIKSCHRYLLAELLAAHTREGKYGGSFENRTRFLLETVRKVREKVGEDFFLTVRLNAYDGLPYPFGWGVDKDDETKPDLAEPKKLVKLLYEGGVSLVSISAGNPYYKYPQITRPFDQPLAGLEPPPEHPLYNVERLFKLAEEIQKAEPRVAIVGSGYSWLRQFFPYAAAANMESGAVSLIGLGREAFAYPDFAKDLMLKGELDTKKVCICCSKCTQIMRDGGKTGCVVRDPDVYVPIYKEGREKVMNLNK